MDVPATAPDDAPHGPVPAGEGNHAAPLVGLGYRPPIGSQIAGALAEFDVLEITLDHYLLGGAVQQAEILGLVGRIELCAHGIGLSLGTDGPVDRRYLDRIAALIEVLNIPVYSEHVAFTRVPGRDLANLLPLPKTEAVAEHLIRNIRIVQSCVPVPLLLENITYLFDWPDSVMSDAEFFNLICRETGTRVLLDVENLYINSCNHGFDPHDFVDALPAGAVGGLHVAGGGIVDGVLVDTHDHPMRAEAMALLDYVLDRHRPETIILERDRRLEAFDEIMADFSRLKTRVASATSGRQHAEPAAA